MKYTEEDLLSLSGLQHMLFCPRQCALIHVEKLWEENRFTAEGRILHERVDRGGERLSGKVRVVYSMTIKSNFLGLLGQADAVEFHESEKGNWLPYPVEYKRGKPKKDFSDDVQLCAQAICLEEMYDVEINEGALFYGKKRRRKTVEFNGELRTLTRNTAEAFHLMIKNCATPKASYEKKCDTCSFISICMPKVLTKKSVNEYLRKVVTQE